MALINCPECDRQVSDQAAACPQCAHPFRSALSAYEPRNVGRVQTIQQTAKQYKIYMLVGALIFFVGCGMFVNDVSDFGNSGQQDTIPGDVILSGMVWIAGLIVLAGARFAAWWNHG